MKVWLSRAYEQPYIENGKSIMEEGELKYIFPSFSCSEMSLIVLIDPSPKWHPKTVFK